MIDRYFEAYPGVRRYLDQTVAGRCQTHRLCRDALWDAAVPSLSSRCATPSNRRFGERTAMNHPMQGTAADIIKIAMVRVAQRLRTRASALA